MNKEINWFIAEFESSFDGEPFFGKPLMAVVRDTNPAEVFNKPIDSSHSAWEITHHLLAWRELMAKRLNGYTGPGIEGDSAEDWAPVPEDKSAKKWSQLISRLEKNQADLLEALPKFKDEDLDKKFAGTNYTLRTFLNGQIQHDIYHIGQIALANKSQPVRDKVAKQLM